MSLSLLSLRWRLIWSLILLQVVVGSLVLGGFIGLAWVAGRMVDETGQETIAVIQRALMRDAQGRLAVAPTRPMGPSGSSRATPRAPKCGTATCPRSTPTWRPRSTASSA